ncbi:MAG: SWIM zinc finger family protein [Polyangiaceae bacterium]|nr:SWIM zinc finger family protein [Polyangiaceae bacterium]
MSTPFASILHKEAVKALADSRAYARGQRYFAEGKVKSVTRNKTSLAGVVEGERSYAVRLWVNESSLAYSCSCPHGEEGNFCKHCVALSLAWLAQAPKAE